MGIGKKAPATFGAKVGSRVRELRVAAKMSQLALARAAGMRPAKLCDLEKGRNPCGPGGETLSLLAHALSVSVDDLLTTPRRPRRAA